MSQVSHAYPVQLVQPDGRRVLNRVYASLVRDIGPEYLRKLYRDMVVVRRLDNEATALQRQGELGLWAPLLGQEAAQVGSAHAIKPNDYIFPSYREHGVAYCRGVELSSLTAAWRGTSHHNWDPAKHAMATHCIVVGAQPLHAVGYGMGVQLDGANTAVITYFGDGATSQGDVAEALGFASHFAVPVVFFCQNNHWAISAPTTVQSRAPLADRAVGYGIPHLQVDGNDVLAVLAVTRQALDRARAGEGPSFIEAVTYRIGPHTTADDPTRYRDQDELTLWRSRDPITRMSRLLEREGLFERAFVDDVNQHAEEAAMELRHATVNAVTPEPLTMFDHVFAAPDTSIEREKRWYRTYLQEISPS